MIGGFIFQVETAKPPVGHIEPEFLTQFPVGSNAVEVTITCMRKKVLDRLMYGYYRDNKARLSDRKLIRDRAPNQFFGAGGCRIQDRQAKTYEKALVETGDNLACFYPLCRLKNINGSQLYISKSWGTLLAVCGLDLTD